MDNHFRSDQPIAFLDVVHRHWQSRFYDFHGYGVSGIVNISGRFPIDVMDWLWGALRPNDNGIRLNSVIVPAEVVL